MKTIKMKMTVDKVNKFCAICDGLNFDVDVSCGRICVDGKSVMGVMEMCGRDVTISPITDDLEAVDMFFDKIKDLGGYYEESKY